MICPLDSQPCTLDHSHACADSCRRQLEKERAAKMYPNHHPETALANYRAGREVYDTNGDLW